MKTLTKIYFGLTFLLLLDLILYLSSEVSLATKWADQILFWLWFFLTFVVVFRQIKKRWAKVYGFVLIGITILSLVPMGIPFLTVIAFMLPNPSPDYLYQDNEIRIEMTTKSVIGRPYIAVVKNYAIFEKEIAEVDAEIEIGGKYYDPFDIRSIHRIDSDNSRNLILSLDFDSVEKRVELYY